MTVAKVTTITTASPAVAKEEESSIAGNVFPSIGGRMVSSWSQSIMIAGIVVAVIGVAAAVFTSSVFAAVGFALLGVISALGVYVAQNAFEGEQLQNSIAQLNRQNSFLDEQTGKIEGTSRLIIAENARLKSAQEMLEGKARELQRENQRMVQANKDLEKAFQDMGAANRAMTENRAALDRKIVEMQQFVSNAKQVLQGFLRINVEFASRVGAFASVVSGLGRTEAQVRATVSEFEHVSTTELPQLTQQLQLARDLSNHIHTHITAQNESLHKLSEDYRAQVTRLEASVAPITTYNASLERQDVAFAAREASIGVATANMETEKRALTELAAELELQRQGIATERERITDEVASLTSIRTQRVEELSRINAELGRLIASKIAELASLQAQIRAARAAIVASSA